MKNPSEDIILDPSNLIFKILTEPQICVVFKPQWES